MKPKILLISLLSVLALTGCGTTPESSSQGGPSTSGDSSSQGGSSSQTVDNQVNQTEWEAAFGSEKPFLFADNYKFNMLAKVNGVDIAEENYYADGNKLKDEPVKAPEGERLGSESYYSFENSKYIAYQFTGGKWSTHETSYTPMHDIVQDSLAPFGNPDLFTYDETSKSYKCETTTIVVWEVTYTNLEIKFVDKKITEVSFTVEGVEDYICTLTYGGQTVTLPEVEPEHSGEENNYSQILKDAATEIMQFNAAPALASRRFAPQETPVQALAFPAVVLRGFAPQEAPGQALAFPAVYLYWAGLLNDIQGVNVVEQAIQSSGTYKFNGMGGNIQSITFDLNVNFDEANNKFTFLGRQDIPGGHSYLVLTCDYNFTSNQLGDFSVLMVPDNNTYGNYIRVKNGVFEMYNYNSSDTHATDPDFIEYNAIFEAGRAILDEKMATENVLEGATLTASQEAFVAACDYCDDITTGTDFDVEIYTGEK